ncbi:MAG TPA: DUF4214 domain-containing protein, partial [Iamia sp.]|nr:DUF4214 domain-containing protein [Iamia sp.]
MVRVGAAALVLAGVAGPTVGPAAAAPAPVPAAPAGAPDDACFADAVLRVFLQRAPSDTEQADLVAQLGAGTPRGTVVRSVARSDAWVKAAVTELFRTVLDRDPDPGGLAYWADRLRTGTTITEIGTAIWASPEMRARIRGGHRGFIGSAYKRILLREIQLAELEYWEPVVAARGWGWMARQLYRSTERRQRQVDRLYSTILGRPPEPAGRQYWVERLLTLNEVELAVQLAASPELPRWAARSCPVPGSVVRAAPGPANGIALSGDGALVVTLTYVGGPTDGYRVVLWDRTTDTRTTVAEWPSLGSEVSGVAIADDGSRV